MPQESPQTTDKDFEILNETIRLGYLADIFVEIKGLQDLNQIGSEEKIWINRVDLNDLKKCLGPQHQ